MAEWLSGWSSHSGRVAEWLSGCFDFASRVAHPLLKDVKQINGRIATVTFASHGYDPTFICAYAPHSGYPTDTKEDFHDQLSKEIALCRGHFYIGCDFNARIQHIRAGDADVCGPYIIGRGMEHMNHMNEKTKESRALSPTPKNVF